MSDLHRARARAETFAHAVDHGPRHSSRLSDDPELMEAVELVGRLRTAGAVAPRPEFNAELRHRLLEQAAARAATTTPTVVPSIPDSSDDPPRARGRRRVRDRYPPSSRPAYPAGGQYRRAGPARRWHRFCRRRSAGDARRHAVRDEAQHRERLDQRQRRGRLPRPARSRAREDPVVRDPARWSATVAHVATINSTLAEFSAQARKGVTRLVASYQQDGDASSDHGGHDVHHQRPPGPR